jgi:hypothetical protein
MNYFSNRIKILDVDLRVYISLTVVLSSLMVSMADSMLINQEKYKKKFIINYDTYNLVQYLVQ